MVDTIVEGQRSACPPSPSHNVKSNCFAGWSAESTRSMWLRGRQYYRFDGSVKGEDRQDMIDAFNKSKRSHLFLVSTRAGNMGSNLQVLYSILY